jgi:exodeoxyribonuclease VII small subunit
MEEEKRNFEDVLQELEQITHQLERSDIPLKEAIEKFEKGRGLALLLKQTLTQVDGTVRKLTEDEQLVDFLKVDSEQDIES